MRSLVTSDGEIPFSRPQKGVDPVADADLVTKGWAVANLGGGGSPVAAADVTCDDASWIGNLDGSGTDVQSVLDAIDALSIGGGLTHPQVMARSLGA